jgi:hypothetical protein
VLVVFVQGVHQTAGQTASPTRTSHRISFPTLQEICRTAESVETGGSRDTCEPHNVDDLDAKQSAWDVQNDVAIVDRTSYCRANGGVADVGLG